MKKYRYVAWLQVICLLLALALPVAAEPTANNTVSESGKLKFDTLGQKSALPQETPGEYEIRLEVPGAQASKEYAEIIVMVDASTSQSQNFDKLKTLLLHIGEAVLDDEENHATIKLTLMGFGVGPSHAGTFSTVGQLEKFLETATQDDLLQERSATNCEVGFTFVNEYINNSSNLLKTYVLYTSDGSANMDETALDWSKWNDGETFDLFRSYTKEHVMGYFTSVELNHIFAGYAPLSVTEAMFPESCAAIAAAAEEFGTESEEFMAALDVLADQIQLNEDYLSLVLQNIFEHDGLVWGQGYSSSRVEKAFQSYFRSYPGMTDSSYGEYMDLFYLILGDSGSTRMPDRFLRAAQASLELQNNPKVAKVFHVGYSGAGNTWMNPDSSTVAYTDKLAYVYNSTFDPHSLSYQELITQIATTVYQDVTVTDPMSKWVHLEEDSIKIYDNTTNELLYDYATRTWYTDTPLVQGDPITVTTNADGRREICWKIKDGSLLVTDRYSLRYLVTLDETVEGFQPGTEYPTNDPTTVAYTDETGTKQTRDIPVPQVEKPVAVVNLTGSKVLEGRALTEGEFRFSVKDGDGTVVATGTNDSTGTIAFTELVFEEEGSYDFQICEEGGTLQGVTYDPAVHTVTVTVTQNSDYTLSADVTYPEGGAVFTNTYTPPAPATVNLTAKKTLSGRDLVEGEFHFTVKDSDGVAVATGSNDTQGTIAFTELVFDQEGTYTLTMTEDPGDVKNVEYDTAEFTVTVQVALVPEENTLLAAVTYPQDGVTFQNAYKEQTPALTPDSGDPVLLMTALFLLSGLSLAALVSRRKA